MHVAMAAKRKRETLDDLLKTVIANEDLTGFCTRAKIRPWTLKRLRDGVGERTHRGTVLAIAAERGVSPERVEKAIKASRDAAKKG